MIRRFWRWFTEPDRPFGHSWTQNPRIPDEPDCDICGIMKDFH